MPVSVSINFHTCVVVGLPSLGLPKILGSLDLISLPLLVELVLHQATLSKPA